MRGALECGVSGRVRHAKNLNIIISQSVAIGKKIFHNWLRLHAACWIEMYMYVNAMFTYNAEEFCKEHMDHLMLFFACSIHLVCTFKVPVSFYCNPWHMTLTQRVPKVILYPLCHRLCQWRHLYIKTDPCNPDAIEDLVFCNSQDCGWIVGNLQSWFLLQATNICFVSVTVAFKTGLFWQKICDTEGIVLP